MQTKERFEKLSEREAEDIIGWMYENYGQQFLKRWVYCSTEMLVKTWQRELADFTVDEVKRGIEQCRTRVYPPNLSEFRLLCRPFLSPEAAFSEAVKGITARRSGRPFNWTHPAIFYAATQFGNELLGATYFQLREQWAYEYSVQLEKRNWPDITAPQVIDSSAEDTREAGIEKKLCEKLRECVNRPNNVSDNKGWAARILKEPQRRTFTVITMAKSALKTDASLAYVHLP